MLEDGSLELWLNRLAAKRAKLNSREVQKAGKPAPILDQKCQRLERYGGCLVGIDCSFRH